MLKNNMLLIVNPQSGKKQGIKVAEKIKTHLLQFNIMHTNSGCYNLLKIAGCYNNRHNIWHYNNRCNNKNDGLLQFLFTNKRIGRSIY